jgi:hypothetical protein
MFVGLYNIFDNCSCENLCLSWTYLNGYNFESFGPIYQSVRAVSLGLRISALEGKK